MGVLGSIPRFKKWLRRSSYLLVLTVCIYLLVDSQKEISAQELGLPYSDDQSSHLRFQEYSFEGNNSKIIDSKSEEQLVLELPVSLNTLPQSDKANPETSENKKQGKKPHKKNSYTKKTRKGSRKILTGATDKNKVNLPLNMKISKEALQKAQNDSKSSAWLLMQPLVQNKSEASQGKIKYLDPSEMDLDDINDIIKGNKELIDVIIKKDPTSTSTSTTSTTTETPTTSTTTQTSTTETTPTSTTSTTTTTELPQPDLVSEKLKIMDFLASNIHVEANNVSHSRHGRTTKDMCNSYKLEGSSDFHKTRLTFGNLFGNINKYPSDDVTLVTQMNSYRMDVLETVSRHWEGPISVAIQVNPRDFAQIGNLFREKPYLLSRQNIDIHIVLEKGEYYPVNYLRNVAFNHSRTDYVFLADVDFVPSIGLRQNLIKRIKDGALTNKQILVVPAFQFLHAPVKSYPRSKKELLKLWSKKKILPFHWYFRYGHRQTDFGRWKKETHKYLIKWEDGFEPYIVGNRTTLPRYSEKFLGRIRNKTSHITELHLLGYNFMALPDVFTIHYPHKSSKNTYYYWCSQTTYASFKKHLKTKHKHKHR